MCFVEPSKKQQSEHPLNKTADNDISSSLPYILLSIHLSIAILLNLLHIQPLLYDINNPPLIISSFQFIFLNPITPLSSYWIIQTYCNNLYKSQLLIYASSQCNYLLRAVPLWLRLFILISFAHIETTLQYSPVLSIHTSTEERLDSISGNIWNMCGLWSVFSSKNICVNILWLSISKYYIRIIWYFFRISYCSRIALY